MKPREKIVLTQAGLLLRKEMKEELNPSPELLMSPKSPVSQISRASTQKNVFKQKIINRGTYFGPKPKTLSVLKASQKIYPNYLKREASEYPSSHVCNFQEKEITKSPKGLKMQHPLAKILHHSVFNSEKRIKIQQSPTIDTVNTIIIHDSFLTPSNLAPAPLRLDTSQDTKDGHCETEPTNISNMHSQRPTKRADNFLNLTKSTNWMIKQQTDRSFFRITSPRNNSIKRQQLLEKHEGFQKSFENTLLKIDKKIKEKQIEQERTQFQLPKFIQKLRTGDEFFDEQQKTLNKDRIRFTERLKTFHENKYEHIWKRMVSPRIDYHRETIKTNEATAETLDNPPTQRGGEILEVNPDKSNSGSPLSGLLIVSERSSVYLLEDLVKE